MTVRFLLKKKPKSFNSCTGSRKQDYSDAISSAFRKYKNAIQPSGIKLYGVIHHFYDIETRIDADNMSKPMWDCLKSLAFEDDYQIKMRTASSIKFTDFEITSFPVTDTLSIDFAEAYQVEKHLIYVEIGVFHPRMIQMNLEES